MIVAWTSIEPPLPAAAVAARGVAGVRLAARAVRGDANWELTRWSEWALVAGPALPWVDGVTYLGLLPGAGGILVPVHRRPRLHPDLVAKAVRSLTRTSAGRVAIIPHDGDQVAVLVLEDHR